jgi:hypothetical protein
MFSVSATGLLITLIVMMAAGVRLWGLDFGLPFPHSRPDEVAIAGPALACLLGDCRPPNFYYPSLVIHLVAALYGLYYAVTMPFGWYESLQAFADSRHDSLLVFLVISRGLSAVAGTLTVYWIYRLGARAADARTGLVAAGFLALAMLHVRDSHFGTSDVVMTGLIVVAVTRALVWLDEPTTRHAALAGAATGLAASAKYNGLGAGLAFAAAALVRLTDRGAAGALRVHGPPVGPHDGLRGFVVSMLVFGAIMLVAFLGTTPYIALEPDRFGTDVLWRGEGLAGGHGPRLPRGWAYHPVVTLPAALGWPVYLCALAGAAWWLVAAPRRAGVVLAFPLAYFAVAGSLLTVFARYVVPLVPFLALTAAWFVVRVVEMIVAGGGERTRAATAGLMATILIAPSALEVWRFDRLLGREDSRVVAARALHRLVRDGQTLHHSGGQYGRVPFDLPGLEIAVREVSFDEVTGRFLMNASGPYLPDWLVVQRSPLVGYSHVPETVDHIAFTRYRLVAAFEALDERPGRVFDQQDAFFCPLSGLAGVERLGPNLYIYERLSEALVDRRTPS